MKKSILFAAALLICASGFAKQPHEPTSYNYQRGVECVHNLDIDEGKSYLEKELQQNPKNGYAYCWLAAAYAYEKEFGKAVYYLDLAQKNLPKADKYYQAWSHKTLAVVYLEMKDTINGLQEYDKAIKIKPDFEDWYEERGRLYGELEQWDKSDADFRQYIKLTPGSIIGYLYLGRNKFMQKNYEEALEQYQYAHKLAVRPFTYSYMAETEIQLGKYEDATDHIIEALKLEAGEETCMDIFSHCKDEEFVELIMNKLRIQTLANPNVVYWYMYILRVQKTQNQYEDAILTCRKIRTLSPDAYFDDYMARLYQDLGDYEHALQCENKAIAEDSTAIGYPYNRAYIYEELDSLEQMYADLNYLIEQNPEDAQLYFTRGCFNLFHKNYEQGINDYDLGLAIESSDDWGRYMRGRCYEATGQTDKAKKDYLRVESSCQNAEIRMFVKASLGKKEEVMALVDSLLKADTINNEYRYNAACVYALLGEKELAMQNLEEELKDGYVRFMHLRHDPDLQSLQGDELETLIRKYEKIAKERIDKFNDEHGEQSGETRVVEIPFTAANGVTKVDCTINGLPLNFVFDTGASDVTISQVEASFMFKNGYLSDKDIAGRQRYQTADGNISEGTVIILRQINFGGLELRDVRASVGRSQEAPLLLGQSVLQRLGKIEIDNQKRVLIVTTK